MELAAEFWECAKHAGSLKHCVEGVEVVVVVRVQCQHPHSLSAPGSRLCSY